MPNSPKLQNTLDFLHRSPLHWILHIPQGCSTPFRSPLDQSACRRSRDHRVRHSDHHSVRPSHGPSRGPAKKGQKHHERQAHTHPIFFGGMSETAPVASSESSVLCT